jgi:hypothetical protein
MIEKDHRFPTHDPIFCPAEREHVDAKVARSLAQSLAETNCGVGDAGAIHVQEHFMFVRELGQRLNFFRLVNRPHFGGLRNRDDTRLHMMLVADAVIGVAHEVQRDFAGLVRQGNQLASGVLLRRSAFVGVDVGVIAAKDGVIRASQSLQAEYVRAGAVEGEEDINAGAEVLFEFGQSGTRVAVVPLSDRMALIDACDRIDYLRVHSGIVVAGKAAKRIGGNFEHKRINLAE